MEILCTRPSCGSRNHFPDLDDPNRLKTTQQKFCTQCGMPLILGGRYLPVKLLGQGGFGAAFLACDRYTTSLRQCVVKQFQPAGNLSPQQLAIAQGLFEREAAVLEDLGREHRQIPDSFAFFPLVTPNRQGNQDEQFFYLVQEFIDGQDLEQELAARGPFSEGEVVEVLREILGVLAFIHSRDVIHRDIKPSNIMRSKQGRLFLLDFGAVKQVASTAAAAAAGGAQNRSTGIYSMGFAPPEQMQGSQVYPSTDLYALGATCLVLLTGKSSEDLFDPYNNNWNWRGFAPQASDRLALILDKMMRPTPKDRFQSAGDVLPFLTAKPKAAAQPAPPPPPPPAAAAQPAPPPPPPIAQPGPPPAPVPQSSRRGSRAPFGLIEALASSAFTGFEGALLFMIIVSLIDAINPISIGLWGMAMGGLIYSQFRRLLEKWDFAILAVITVVLLNFVPWLNRSEALGAVLGGLGLSGLMGYLFLAVFAAAIVVLITALFRLIYQLLTSLL
ncbi:MAG: serine/threonine protein kinase [Spirulina sp. DLM2.Bin59]|nr:MAG: serine/threonine protein kinase [Spirulina sp. DLM2.Bin59]